MGLTALARTTRSVSVGSTRTRRLLAMLVEWWLWLWREVFDLVYDELGESVSDLRWMG
jgi:hypothetical protein